MKAFMRGVIVRGMIVALLVGLVGISQAWANDSESSISSPKDNSLIVPGDNDAGLGGFDLKARVKGTVGHSIVFYRNDCDTFDESCVRTEGGYSDIGTPLKCVAVDGLLIDYDSSPTGPCNRGPVDKYPFQTLWTLTHDVTKSWPESGLTLEVHTWSGPTDSATARARLFVERHLDPQFHPSASAGLGIPLITGIPALASPALGGDLDGDGNDEIVTASNYDGTVIATNHLGQRIFESTPLGVPPATVFSPPVIADVTGDGKKDIIVTVDVEGTDSVFVFSPTFPFSGPQPPIYKNPELGAIRASPIVLRESTHPSHDTVFAAAGRSHIGGSWWRNKTTGVYDPFTPITPLTCTTDGQTHLDYRNVKHYDLSGRTIVPCDNVRTQDSPFVAANRGLFPYPDPGGGVINQNELGGLNSFWYYEVDESPVVQNWYAEAWNDTSVPTPGSGGTFKSVFLSLDNTDKVRVLLPKIIRDQANRDCYDQGNCHDTYNTLVLRDPLKNLDVTSLTLAPDEYLMYGAATTANINSEAGELRVFVTGQLGDVYVFSGPTMTPVCTAKLRNQAGDTPDRGSQAPIPMRVKGQWVVGVQGDSGLMYLFDPDTCQLVRFFKKDGSYASPRAYGRRERTVASRPAPEALFTRNTSGLWTDASELGRNSSLAVSALYGGNCPVIVSAPQDAILAWNVGCEPDAAPYDVQAWPQEYGGSDASNTPTSMEFEVEVEAGTDVVGTYPATFPIAPLRLKTADKDTAVTTDGGTGLTTLRVTPFTRRQSLTDGGGATEDISVPQETGCEGNVIKFTATKDARTAVKCVAAPDTSWSVLKQKISITLPPPPKLGTSKAGSKTLNK